MKKKVLSVVLAAVSAAVMGTALCACTGGDLSFINRDGLLSTYQTGYQSTVVPALNGCEYVSDGSANSDMCVFVKEGEYADTYVYSVCDLSKHCNIVLTKTSSESERNGISVHKSGLITVTTVKNDVKTYTVYSRSGKKIYGDSKNAPQFEYDLVIDGNRYYRYDENGETFDSYERAATAGELPSGVISFDTTDGNSIYHRNYYYVASSVSNVNTVSVYDNKFNYLSSWVSPANAQYSNASVLADGTLFVQYIMQLPSDAKDYDFYEDGDKFEICKLTVDPETGKTKTVKGDFVVNTIVWNSKKRDGIISNDIDNIAVVSKYKDGVTDSVPYLYELKSNGKLGVCMSEYEGKSVNFEPVGNGYLIMNYTLGNGKFLVDKDLEIVGDISGITYSNFTQNMGREYLWNDNGIYNYRLRKLVDLTDAEYSDYEYVQKAGDNPIYRKAVNGSSYNYYIFAYDEFTLIENYGGVEGVMYYTETQDDRSGTKYNYYLADEKNSETTTTQPVNLIKSSTDAYLYEFTWNDDVSYRYVARS